MILTSFRNSLLFLFLISVTTPAWADTAFIYYKNSGNAETSSQYANLKSQLEDLGYTVSSSTSGSVSSSDISGKDLVIDITGESNCGSTCKTNYDNYVSAGGKLLIVGSNGATNRNSSIEALIESKMSVGSFTQGPNNGGCANCYYSTRKGDFSSSTASENTLPGSDKYMYNVTGGTTVAANSSLNNNISIWHKWDYGSNGGAVYVTFGYGQFLTTRSYASNMDDMLLSIMVEEGLYTTSTYTSSISNAQTTQVATSRAVTGSGIYISQVGNDNTLNITQDGEDNLIAGVGSTTSNIVNADITGNNNNNTMTQRGDDNVILFDMVGHSNTTVIDQGGSAGADDNRLEFDIVGNGNTFNVTQKHNDGVGTNGHYVGVDIDGSNNNVLTSQLNDGDKKAFLSVQGDDNDIDLYQQGAGSHYAEIAVGSDQTVAITQDGTGNHNASINMTGHSATLNLTQDSSTNQVYSIQQYCNTANGCGTTTVTQN